VKSNKSFRAIWVFEGARVGHGSSLEGPVEEVEVVLGITGGGENVYEGVATDGFNGGEVSSRTLAAFEISACRIRPAA
jgi:hypothetical protein